MDKYKYKYYLYKNKYLQLKTQIGGVKENSKHVWHNKTNPNPNGNPVIDRRSIENRLEALRSKPQDFNVRQLIKKYEKLLEPFLVEDQIRLVEEQPPRQVNSVLPNHQLTGKQYIGDVNNIHYTQNSISHTFTDPKYNITTNIEKLSSHFKTNNIRQPFNKDQLNEFFKADITTLDCIIDTKNIIYSCNNRRLCFLKQIHNAKLFDGKIQVKITNKCTHDIDVNQSVDVQMGNKPSWKC